MAVRDIENSKILKEYGKILGREEIAKMVIKLCKKVAEDESYINSIVALGHLKALAIACNYDSYWSEKCWIGFEDRLYVAEKRVMQAKQNTVMDKLIQQAQGE